VTRTATVAWRRAVGRRLNAWGLRGAVAAVRRTLGSPAVRPDRLLAARLGWCPLPDFLIVGTQKGGTTSLYEYIVRHPYVRGALAKEVQFFTLHWQRGFTWYRAHFPPRRTPGAFLTGEASPFYLFHPDVPARVAAGVPGVRVLALLRDPVERAWSHYQHERRRGRETRDFAAAIEASLAQAEGGLAPGTEDFRHRSYVARGYYADQLERWLAVVPRERLFVALSEDFFREPGAVYARVLDFLGLPPWRPRSFPLHNVGLGGAPDQATRERLASLYRPHNARLPALCGVDVDGWT